MAPVRTALEKNAANETTSQTFIISPEKGFQCWCKRGTKITVISIIKGMLINLQKNASEICPILSRLYSLLVS